MFEKGHKKVGGRTRRSADPEAVLLRDVMWAHKQRGKKALLDWSKKSHTTETEFYKLLAKIVPDKKEKNGGVNITFVNDLKEKDKKDDGK